MNKWCSPADKQFTIKKTTEIKYKSPCHQLTNVKIYIYRKKNLQYKTAKCDDTYMLQLTRIKIFIQIIV